MRPLDRRKYLDPQEQAVLFKHLDERATIALAKGHRVPVRDRMVIRLAVVSGLRASELCALTIGDLSLIRGKPIWLTVRRGKGGKRREVPLPSSMRAELNTYLSWLESAGFEADDAAPLIPGRSGQPMSRSGLWKRWQAALKGAGISHRPLHASRHSAGLVLYRETKDLRLVQRVLGHARVTTTTIYADVTPDDMSNAVDRAWASK